MRGGATGRGGDEYGDEVRERQGAFGIVGAAGDPAYGGDLVEGDGRAGEDEGQRQERGTGVAVVERMEEADVEVGAGGAGRERKGRVRALGEAGVKVVGKVRAGAVAFAALFGVGRKRAERRGAGGAQDVSLPGGESREGQRRARRRVGAGPVEGGAEAGGAQRGPVVVVGVDVLHRPVFYRGDGYDWEAFVKAGGREPHCTCPVPGDRVADGQPYP